MSLYDGSRVAAHTVRPGESLSKIAATYRFQRWEPIWIYNTKVHQVLGSNPDRIGIGTKLLIPRSRKGYDDRIKALEALKREFSGHSDKIRFELEKANNDHKEVRVYADLAGDIGTLLGTVGAKAYKAASSARAATTAKGSSKVAAQYLADKDAADVGKFLATNFKDKSVNAALTTLDPEAGKAHKDLYLTQKKGVQAIAGVSLQKGKSLLDIADLVLDYVTVSSLADGLIWLTVGETPEKTYNEAQKTLRTSTQQTLAMLDTKIANWKQERTLVYSSRA
jgi:hypothetical protein